MKRVVLNVILPVLVLGAAGVGARGLLSSAQSSESKAQPEAAPLVELAIAQAYAGPALVEGTGVVEAEREASLSTEVSGRVKQISDHLVEGGRVQEGDVLVRVDDARYRLAIKQQRAQVKRAELEVEVERNAGEAARREWQVSGREPPSDARRIALRAPQLELAQANVDMTKAALQAAELDVSRSVLRAPFNATITSESVERGDLVSPGFVIARLVGTDRFVARISIPVEDLRFVQVGGTAAVTQRLDDATIVTRTAEVLRVVSELDPESRTARVLLGIDNPLDPPAGELPLYVGAFVTARIEGGALDQAARIPRSAVFEGNRVWIVDDEGRLRPRALTIAFGDSETVVVSKGVAADERVVITTLTEPFEGMLVRTTKAEHG
jgi:RND family efflux transporter MFP subunit